MPSRSLLCPLLLANHSGGFGILEDLIEVSFLFVRDVLDFRLHCLREQVTDGIRKVTVPSHKLNGGDLFPQFQEATECDRIVKNSCFWHTPIIQEFA